MHRRTVLVSVFGGVLAAALLLTLVVPFSVSLCANGASIWLLKKYSMPGSFAIPSAVCPVWLRQVQMSVWPSDPPWQYSFVNYVQGQLDHVESGLSGSTKKMSDERKVMLLDTLLAFTPVAWRGDPAGADLVVSFARSHGQASIRGYLALANFYIGLVRAGDPRWLGKAHEALQLAARASIPGSAVVWPRAEAWFRLGDLALQEKNDSLAVDCFQAAIRDDPRDESWGYAWMSAMQLVDIYSRQENWAEARAVLAYAETLPDRYHRYSHTRLRLAQLEVKLGERGQAIAILEGAIARDPSFALTRLYLANLYVVANRPQDAVQQYRQVLQLDPNQTEARQALLTLEGK